MRPLVLIVALFVPPVVLAADEPAAVRVGMTQEEVRITLKPPRRIARQVLYGRYLEVWYYDQPHPLWIEFEYRKGREMRVVNVQSPSRPTP
jgi:hypothetical protein